MVGAGEMHCLSSGTMTAREPLLPRRFPCGPDFAEAWLGRGNVDCVLARLDEALAAYDKVLTLKPDSADASIGRGVVLGGRRKFDDALDAIDRGLALKPNSREGWLARGRMLFEINRIAEAVAAYDKALLVEPDFADVISSRVFAVDFLTESDFATQQEARNLWWQKIGSPIAERSQAHYRDTVDPGSPAQGRICVIRFSTAFRGAVLSADAGLSRQGPFRDCLLFLLDRGGRCSPGNFRN